MPYITPFSIPCESWGSATTWSGWPSWRAGGTFSIPCESWGSATSLMTNHHISRHAFQYSLRIVGFRDCECSTDHREYCAFSIPCESWGSATAHKVITVFAAILTFSIPCESWGSATARCPNTAFCHPVFQYSLRIVGFRDALHASSAARA